MSLLRFRLALNPILPYSLSLGIDLEVEMENLRIKKVQKFDEFLLVWNQ